MTQGTLDFGPSDRVDRAYTRVLAALCDCVESIGVNNAAAVCRTRRQDLNDALSGREGRYVRLEWLLAILDASPLDERARLNAALMKWQGLVAAPERPRTPAERLSSMREAIARIAPGLLPLIDQELGD